MSDEQTIYISPEDDLTIIRERLEQISARNITLVIPSQTQLRSYVYWKLLYTRARELGKDILIVSSDPQVRSVAHSVKFKVAHSLESAPQAGKARGTSRPGRSSRTPKAPAGPATRMPIKTPRNLSDTRNTNAQAPRPPEEELWYIAPDKRRTEATDYSEQSSHTDDTSTGGLHRAHTSSFEIEEPQYQQAYDFHIGPASKASNTPSIHPLPTEQIEEPDLLFEDYTQAQGIRQAASEGRKDSGQEHQTEQEPDEKQYRITPRPRIDDDPFSYMEDSQPPPRAEQQGAAAIHDFDIEDVASQPPVQNIADLPTGNLENAIEYRADRDKFVPQYSPRPSTRAEETREGSPPQNIAAQPRRSRNLQPVPYAPGRQNFEEDALPPIQDRPTRIVRNSRPMAPREPDTRTSGSRAVGPDTRTGATGRTKVSAGPKTAASAGPRTNSGRQPELSRPAPRSAAAAQAQRPGGATRTAAGGVGAGAASRRPAARKKARGIFPMLAIAIIILLALGSIVYFGPSASIKITVTAQDYAHSVNLTASLTPQAHNSILAEKRSKQFSKTALEPASGSKKVGTQPATGFVTFTNNGKVAIDVPTNTIIAATGNTIQFETTSDVYIGPGEAVPVTIQAVQPGENGNLPAGSITVIPDSSRSAIVQHQVPKIADSDLNLSVNNEHEIKGGGAQPQPVIVSKDLDNAKNDLQQQLDNDVNDWLKQLASNGISGNAQKSATLTSEQGVDSIVTSGKFSATVTLNVSVLFVSNSNVQKAAVEQLNSALGSDTKLKGYKIVENPQSPIKIDQTKTGGDSNSLTIAFNGSGKAAPDLAVTRVQDAVAGKAVADARATLQNIQGVQKVDIEVSPGFLPWITSIKSKINVIDQAATGPVPASTPTAKPTK